MDSPTGDLLGFEEEKPEPMEPVTSSDSVVDESNNADNSCLIEQSHAAAVVNLVYWRCPLRSAIVLIIALVLEMSLMCCSFISVVAYLGLCVCIVSLSFRTYKQLTAHENPFASYSELVLSGKSIIPESCVQKTTEKASKFVNHGANYVAPLIFVENYLNTLKFMFCLWLATYIGACFNFLTLVMLATITSFSAPRIYEDYKVQIDDALRKAMDKMAEVRSMVMEKINTLPVIGQKAKAN